MCVSAIPRDSLLFAPSLQATVNIPQRKGNITTFGTDYWWTTSGGSGHGDGGGGGIGCTSGRGVRYLLCATVDLGLLVPAGISGLKNLPNL